MIERIWNIDLSGTDVEICARIAEIMAELEALGTLDERAR